MGHTKLDDSKNKKTDFSFDNEKIAQMFVDDFLSLDPNEVIKKYKRHYGTHPFPRKDLIYKAAETRDISLFLSSEKDLERKLEEQFDGVPLVKDSEAGCNGFRLIYLENGEYTKGSFFFR